MKLNRYFAALVHIEHKRTLCSDDTTWSLPSPSSSKIILSIYFFNKKERIENFSINIKEEKPKKLNKAIRNNVKYDLDWSSRELRIIETELADREDILDEMVLYKRDINKWKKKHDKRIKREISLGYKNWRKCIGKVNVLAKEKVAIRIIVNSSNLIKWHDSITPFMKLELGCLRTINTNIIKNNLKIDTDEEEIGWGGTIFADLNDIYWTRNQVGKLITGKK